MDNELIESLFFISFIAIGILIVIILIYRQHIRIKYNKPFSEQLLLNFVLGVLFIFFGLMIDLVGFAVITPGRYGPDSVIVVFIIGIIIVVIGMIKIITTTIKFIVRRFKSKNYK